jgi:hypothetical protein
LQFHIHFLSDTSPSVSLHLSLVSQYYIPHLLHNFILTYFVFIISLLFFPLLQSTLLRTFYLPALHVVNLTWDNFGSRLLLSHIAFFVFLSFFPFNIIMDLFSIIYSLLCCLLISFFQFVPVLYSTIGR